MPDILIIEDDKVTAEGIRSIFDAEGFGVDIANNGKVAFDWIFTKNYSIIISDLMMPEMDGLQFLNRLRSYGNDIPVIIITAYGNVENMLTVFEMGAVEILEKPFDIDELIDLVKSLI